MVRMKGFGRTVMRDAIRVVLPNQTWVNGSGPAHAIEAHGQFSYQVNNKLSYLPGLRFPSLYLSG